MSAVTASNAARTADYVNPVLIAARTVFERMLGCTPKRTGLTLKKTMSPKHELSAVIGITGKAAGTIVVYNQGIAKPHGQIKAEQLLPPPVSLRLDEQRAIINFAQRGPLLPNERANELASIPKALFNHLASGSNPLTALYGIGAWLAGLRKSKP